jgi:hypothetical protein
MPVELERRLSAGVGLVRGSTEIRSRFISADRSAPLEVVLDLIHDRDLVEFHSLLAQHLAVAMP